MPIAYHKLLPEEIVDDVTQSNEVKRVQIKGSEFLVYPHVYPSDRFRTTNFILDSIEPLLSEAIVCDMGCGIGVIGLFALGHGARQVVQADINPLAIENAKANRDLYHYSNEKIKIYESDCFDNVPLQVFDIVVFNIPFHSEPHEIEDPLEYAFYDPNFRSTKKFLSQVPKYSHAGTRIFIAFSNKGDLQGLEKIFDDSGCKWELWKIANQDQKYDNRLYVLQIRCT